MIIKPLKQLMQGEIKLFQQLRPHLENKEKFLEAFGLAQKSEIKFWALYQKEKVKGIISYRVMFNLYLGEHMVIDDLIVDKKVRGEGIGTKLMEKVIQIAKEKNIKIIKLDSGLQRTQAHNFYEKLGWDKKCYTFEKKIL